MRTDVKKIIAERPKANRTWQSNTRRVKTVQLDVEGDQFDEGSNHLPQKRQKMRNTSLNVIKRFLAKKVGSRWDEVFSEICKNADPRSLQGAEIRQAVIDMVAIDCWTEGKSIQAHDWRGVSVEVKGFYVHPKSRLLQQR